MSDYITASFTTLVGQASDTVATYLYRAKSEIDKHFGEGYAAKNPQLVAAFIQAAASDMNSSAQAKVFGAALQEIASAVSAVAEALDRNN